MNDLQSSDIILHPWWVQHLKICIKVWISCYDPLTDWLLRATNCQSSKCLDSLLESELCSATTHQYAWGPIRLMLLDGQHLGTCHLGTCNWPLIKLTLSMLFNLQQVSYQTTSISPSGYSSIKAPMPVCSKNLISVTPSHYDNVLHS